MKRLYLHRKEYMKKIRRLYLNIDQNDSQQISMNEFFDIIDVIERYPEFDAPSFSDQAIWMTIRAKANGGRWSLKVISRSWIFETIMMVLLIVNCTFLILGMLSDDPGMIEWADYSDNMFFWVYFVEFLIKVIGNGVEKYFNDSWNVLDFSMILLSMINFLLSQTLSFLKNAKSAKATKLLKIIKINRIFRIFKALKNFQML